MFRQVKLLALIVLAGAGFGVWFAWGRGDDDGGATLAASAEVDEEQERRAQLQGRAPPPGLYKPVEFEVGQTSGHGLYDTERFRRVLEAKDRRGALRAMIEDETDPNVRQAARFLLLGYLLGGGPADDAITYAAELLTRMIRFRDPVPPETEMADRSLFAGLVQTDEGADPVDFQQIYADVRNTTNAKGLFGYMYAVASQFAGKPESARTVSREVRLATYNFVRLNDIFLKWPPRAGAKEDMRDFVRWYHASRDESIAAYVAYFRRAYPDTLK